MFSVTSYVPMLQARYRSFVELDNSVGLVHLNWFTKERPSLLLIMPVLCGVTQNKATFQNYNGLKTTLLELLRETLIMSISEVLIYYMSSTGHQSKRDVISFQWVMMFKAINGLTPPYLTDSIVRANETHDHNTRLANSYDVYVPSYDSEILKRSFVYNGSVLWNSLRREVKLADNVNAFKRMYKDMILFPSQLCR